MQDDLSCIIYVDMSQAELNEKLSLLPLEKEGSVFYGSDNEIEIIRNLGFDRVKRLEFPDGFLFFQQLLEIFPAASKTVSLENQVELVSKLLSYLWSQGIPAVAACDYEDQLPNEGGFNSKNIPWTSS